MNEMHTKRVDVTEVELRRHPLFADLAADQLEAIRLTTRIRRFTEGQRLFEAGDPARHFFLVREGHIKLFRLAANGAEKIVEILGPGQTFAEAVMFMTLRAYPVSAEAVAPSEVLAFDADGFLAILRDSPETCLRLLGSLSMRLHRRISEIEALSLQNAKLRVINFMLQEAGPAAGDGTQLALDVPKKIVASRLSLQPETFSRILHNLQTAGVIEVRGRTITIRDLARLRRLAVQDEGGTA